MAFLDVVRRVISVYGGHRRILRGELICGMKRVCPHCGCRFTPCPRVKNQRFCGKHECRKAWKREWQRNKLKQDADYRANQKAAHQAWCKEHPEYWRTYRQRNPRQAEANRVRQRKRAKECRPRLTPMVRTEQFAKMDSIFQGNLDQKPMLAGRYRLSPVDAGEVAKMDSIIVEISTISALHQHNGGGGSGLQREYSIGF